MNGCPAIPAGGAGGIADALRAVDCLSSRAAATAFSRLFGAEGALGPALTAVLTIYVGLLAINLLTGRSRLGVSMLTPRAFALGLALTFATSWIAYQSVVWNLAVGAPDQVASIVTGTRGSATVAFANRLDVLFDSVASAAEDAQARQSDSTPKAAGFSPADVLWLGAALLLLGTVGVLLVARIALAALLALGPIFVVLSLFQGTRGLFEGWLKGLALFALTPLFAVLIGGGAVAILTPLTASLAGGEVDMRAAFTVLLGAVVYCALMAVVLKVGVTLTSGWRLPGGNARADRAADASRQTSSISVEGRPGAATAHGTTLASHSINDQRVREIVSGAANAGVAAAAAPDSPAAAGSRVRSLAAATAADAQPSFSTDDRARGIGSQFRLPPAVRETLPC